MSIIIRFFELSFESMIVPVELLVGGLVIMALGILAWWEAGKRSEVDR